MAPKTSKRGREQLQQTGELVGLPPRYPKLKPDDVNILPKISPRNKFETGQRRLFRHQFKFQESMQSSPSPSLMTSRILSSLSTLNNGPSKRQGLKQKLVAWTDKGKNSMMSSSSSVETKKAAKPITIPSTKMLVRFDNSSIYKNYNPGGG